MNRPDGASRHGLSHILRLDRLERETRRYLYTGFGLGVVLVAVILMLVPYERVRYQRDTERERRMTLDIVDAPPSIRNPYEDWEGPAIRRELEGKPFRPYIPEDYTTRFEPSDTFWETFPVPSGDVRLDTDELVAEALREDVVDTLLAAIDSLYAPEGTPYRDLRISREPSGRSSLRDELLTLDDIDRTGLYKGFVIQDYSDPRAVTGFIHIPPVTGSAITDAPAGIAHALTTLAGIEATLDSAVTFTTPGLGGYPLIYFSLRALHRLDRTAADSLGSYLRQGGLIVLDNATPWHEYRPGEMSLHLMLVDALGKDVTFAPIPEDDPLFYCFFDIRGPSPRGAEDWSPDPDPREGRIPDWGELFHDPGTWSKLESMRGIVDNAGPALMGAWLGDRLVAIYCDRGYGHIWSRYQDSGWIESHAGQFRLAVNIAVYALIRRDGPAMRLLVNPRTAPRADE